MGFHFIGPDKSFKDKDELAQKIKEAVKEIPLEFIRDSIDDLIELKNILLKIILLKFTLLNISFDKIILIKFILW